MSLLLALLAALVPAQGQGQDLAGQPLAGKGAPTPASPPAEGAKHRLDRVQAELEEALAARHTRRAASLGAPSDGQPKAADSAWWNLFLQGEGNALDGLWTPELSAFDRGLRDGLAALVRSESILASSLPRRRWDPVFLAELVEDAVERASRTSGGERSTLLERVRETLREAPNVLVSPRSRWIEEAILRIGALRMRLAGMGDDEAVADAGLACDEFLGWLREASTVYGDALPRLGERNWESLIRAITGTTLDTRALRVRLLREIARLDTELGPYVPPRVVPDMTRDAILAKARDHSLFARNGARAADVVPPLRLEISVEGVAGGGYPTPFLRVTHRPGGTRLLVTEPNDLWPQSLRDGYGVEIHHWVLGAAAIRYCMPGEGTLCGVARRDGETGPMCWNRSVVEGWGLYALDWLVRHPATAERFERFPPLVREMRRARLLATARLLAALEWNTLGYAEGAVAQGLADRTGLDPTMTQLEARRVTHDPLYGIGALGALELRDLEDVVKRELAPPDPIRMVLELVIARPALRPRDLLAHGLAGTPPGGE